MTRRRWIADEVAGNTAALTGRHALHLSRVLRAQVGQEFDIATGDTVRRGLVTSVSDHRVEFALGDTQPAVIVANVTLALAVFKFDRLEWAIEKCTELGVARVIPVIARRTDAHLAAAAVKRRERWERLARQAAEQSRRPSAPNIEVPRPLQDLIGDEETKPAVRVVLAESGASLRVRDVLPESGDVILAVGPEGGWTDGELAAFQASGWVAASLGDTILRAETAAIVAAALALDSLR